RETETLSIFRVHLGRRPIQAVRSKGRRGSAQPRRGEERRRGPLRSPPPHTTPPASHHTPSARIAQSEPSIGPWKNSAGRPTHASRPGRARRSAALPSTRSRNSSLRSVKKWRMLPQLNPPLLRFPPPPPHSPLSPHRQ